MNALSPGTPTPSATNTPSPSLTSDNNSGEDTAGTVFADASAAATDVTEGGSSSAVTNADASGTAEVSIAANASSGGASLEGSLSGSSDTYLCLFSANVDIGDTQAEVKAKDSSSSDNTSGIWDLGYSGYGGYSGASYSGGG